MISGLVDTDDLPGSLARIRSNEGTREPIAQQLALVVQLLTGGGIATGGIEEAPLDGQLYVRQSASWSALSGLWQECTYPAGCSGPLYARVVGDPQLGAIIQVSGQASSVSMWDTSYSFILAYLPPGMTPNADRFALLPSSHTAGTPDSISCAWFKPTGEIAIAFIYEKGQNPLIAWFDSVSIQV